MYVGTHGMAHGLASVLEAARALADDPNLLFVFVGEGAEKDALKRQAADWGLSNVQFIDQQPKARVPLFYAACDLGLVTLRDTPLFQEVLPSKIFEYLGMERPIVLAVGGEARKVVEAAGAGEYVPPGDGAALAAAVRRLAADRARLAAMGRAGRAYVLEHFDRGRLAGDYLDVLARIVRPSRSHS
jgi:glycosyltransferase involved in cell wall biosynthesis